MDTYRLYVYCRRNGVSQDAGLHSEGEYLDDRTAKENLRRKGRQLYRYYDQVIMTFKRVMSSGEEVEI